MNKYEQRVKELRGRFINSFDEELLSSLTAERCLSLASEFGDLQSPDHREKLSENEMQDIERNIGHVLPSDYREFLMDFGGYSFSNVRYPVKKEENEVKTAELSYFYGLKVGTTADLLRTYRGDVANQVMAPELLPIATSGAGSRICLFLTGEREGSVHFWRQEQAVVPYDYSNLYAIANSFDEFMNVLELHPEE